MLVCFSSVHSADDAGTLGGPQGAFLNPGRPLGDPRIDVLNPGMILGDAPAPVDPAGAEHAVIPQLDRADPDPEKCL